MSDNKSTEDLVKDARAAISDIHGFIFAVQDLLKDAKAAVSALRSYQYGNASPDLAKEIADQTEKGISKVEPYFKGEQP